MVIKILVTGGTFDKEYNEISGELYFNGTHIREILDLGRAQIDVEIKELMLIDSLDMQDKEREIIVQNCKDIKSDQIVIVLNGTKL